MANVSYDTLTIKINADSQSANKSLNALTKNLTKFNDEIKTLDTKRINQVEKMLLKIASIDFSNVSQGLQDIVSAFKQFQSKNFIKGVGGLSGTRQDKASLLGQFQLPDFSRFGQAKTELAGFDIIQQNIANNMKKVNEETQKFMAMGLEIKNPFANILNDTEQLALKLYNLGLNGNQVSAVLNSIDNSMGEISPQQLQAVEQILRDTGMSAKEVERTLKRIGKAGEQGGKQASGGAKQLALQFKNILKYRLVRKIIQEVFQAISNAVSELASVDKDFDQSMGEIKSAFAYIGRVLVSVVAPIIKVIAPIITMIAEAIGFIGSTLANTFAGALGQEEFAEAEESVESYTESLKKAKSVSLGIDELNVVGQESDGNYQMKQTEAMGNLGDVLNNLKEKLKPLLEAIKTLFEKLQPVLIEIIDIISLILADTMDDVVGSLIAFINMLGTILQVIGVLLKALSPIINLLTTIGNQGLNGINTIISLVSILVNSCLIPLLPLLDLIGGILQYLAPAFEIIGEFFKATTGSSDNDIARVIAGVLSGGGSELIRWLKSISFAGGGYPEDGMFFANSNELVGTFDNGRTAVANNQQITQGIYQAVLQAMRDSGGNNISVQLDGYEVARIITKRQNNFGTKTIVGGNINYGK